MIEHNGKKYARVSDILRPFSNFDGIDPQVLSNKARIGTSAHQAIADDMAGSFPSPDKDAMGYFGSYLSWKLQIDFTTVQSEMRYFDDERMVTGQIDALIKFPHSILDLPVLIDFKTSAQESKEAWPMQAHLYNYLLAKNGILVGPKYLFVRLNKYGHLPEVFEYLWNSNTNAKCMQAIASFWKTDNK